MQRQLTQWWALQYPQTWKKTFHCPSGIASTALQGALFKRIGWKAGIPDLLCFARRGPYVGLAIELKAGPNKPTAAQKEWLAALEAEAWSVGWFNNLAAAGDFVDRYHAFPPAIPRQYSID